MQTDLSIVAPKRDRRGRGLVVTGRALAVASPGVVPALPPLFRELAAAGLSPAALACALTEARRSGVSFEDALYCRSEPGEAEVARLLSRHYGLHDAPPDSEPAGTGTTLPEAAATGLLRLQSGRIAIVPRGPLFHRMLATVPPALLRERICLLARSDLARRAMLADGERVAFEAAGGLARTTPRFAAAMGASPWQSAAAIGLAVCGSSCLLAAPAATVCVLQFAASLCFLALAWTRIVACASPGESVPPQLRVPDAVLPVYTILVALHRERATVPGLISALVRLDYPRTKLDIKLLVEESDALTRTVLDAAALPPWFEVVVVPPGNPTTKPRALNVGLMTARGEFTVVYDAEDRPAPRQLRDALARFASSGSRTAVVQARLAIDTGQRGFIADQFRFEYAGHFSVLLPALATFRLPVPLGGSSNHFRTRSLRGIGAWDSANVTEDADIGVRLRRLGLRAETIASSTGEEAPASFDSWLRQRTRWMKGWMVTALVHTRSPSSLVRDLGPGGAAMFVLLTGGVIASALLEPVCLVVVGAALLRGSFWTDSASLFEAIGWSIFSTSLVIGHAAAAMVGIKGLSRQGQRASAGMILLLPVYWLATSVATWRAGWQVFRDPCKWEKTEHVLERLP